MSVTATGSHRHVAAASTRSDLEPFSIYLSMTLSVLTPPPISAPFGFSRLLVTVDIRDGHANASLLVF